jgi:hypothetical protein
MERVVARFRSHEEADRANRLYYRRLTPAERLRILLEIIAEADNAPEQGFARVYRIVKLPRR